MWLSVVHIKGATNSCVTNKKTEKGGAALSNRLLVSIKMLEKSVMHFFPKIIQPASKPFFLQSKVTPKALSLCCICPQGPSSLLVSCQHCFSAKQGGAREIRKEKIHLTQKECCDSKGEAQQEVLSVSLSENLEKQHAHPPTVFAHTN